MHNEYYKMKIIMKIIIQKKVLLIAEKEISQKDTEFITYRRKLNTSIVFITHSSCD